MARDYNSPPMPRITFLGAAGTVTGSKYLIEAAGKRLLIDCGLFQGGKELTQRNWAPLPQNPASIDFVALTHAHLDHTGYLPRLVSDGFRGPIFANEATQELCGLLLPDSAHIMEEDAAHATRHGYSSHKPALPLYTQDEAAETLKRFAPLPRLGECRICPEFLIRSHDAGHILGSSSLELVITEDGKNTTILFSGDIGRYGQPLMKDPERPPQADFVLCESTYGDRDHPSVPPPDEALAEVIHRVARRGGVIVVPAFAVDRTQLLLYDIRRLERAQRVPPLPIYMDSPMAIGVTEIYREHREDLKIGMEELHANASSMQAVHVMRSPEESKQINNVHTPAIIISASGMATGGRVLHHLSSTPAGRAQLRAAGWLPGRRHAGAGAGGRREVDPNSRRGRAGAGRSRQPAAIFGARRTQRADALARRNSGAASADFSSARRAGGSPSPSSGDKDRTALECDGSELSAEC